MIRIRIILDLIKIVFQSLLYKNKIFIMGIPIHGNLGDQAILYAEEKLFNDKYPNKKIIEIQSIISSKFTKLLKIIIRKNDIYIHGGGFLGNLWMKEEIMFRKIIKNFPNNKIFVLPQTIFFTEDEKGMKEYSISKKIYESHNNLTFLLREDYSYKYMKKYFSNCKIELKPDMVLYLNINDFNINKSKNEEYALFCIRNDLEKIDYDFKKVINSLKNNNIVDIRYTDTVISKNVYSNNRKYELSKKLSEFKNSKIIITDRLHGMIFSLIAEKPCLAFQNKSYKILGVYKWIKNNKYIHMHDDNKKINDEINELLSLDCTYNNKHLKKKLFDMI